MYALLLERRDARQIVLVANNSPMIFYRKSYIPTSSYPKVRQDATKKASATKGRTSRDPSAGFVLLHVTLFWGSSWSVTLSVKNSNPEMRVPLQAPSLSGGNVAHSSSSCQRAVYGCAGLALVPELLLLTMIHLPERVPYYSLILGLILAKHISAKY